MTYMKDVTTFQEKVILAIIDLFYSDVAQAVSCLESYLSVFPHNPAGLRLLYTFREFQEVQDLREELYPIDG